MNSYDAIEVELKDGVSKISLTKEELLESNAEINRLRKIEEAAKNLIKSILDNGMLDDELCQACLKWYPPNAPHTYCTFQVLKDLLEKT